jgi:hypothetical protein
MDYKPLCFLRSFESICQAADGMRVPLASLFPSDFRSRTPQLGALVYGRMRDNKAIIVIQVSHIIILERL